MVARVLLLSALLLGAGEAAAQPAASAEVIAGWSGFLDDALINHAVYGGAGRLQLGRRISVGPELVYMRGPGFDRDLFVTGNLTFDLRPQAPGARPRLSPFLVVGAGAFRHTDRFGASAFSSWEGAVTGGGGLRVMLTPAVYALIETRLGWEPHLRITGGLGIATR